LINAGIHRTLEEGRIQNACVPVMRRQGMASFSPLPALPAQDVAKENRNDRDLD
jgi:hypothetical protein